jgi:2-polyprenyl-6-hydroxyphenyl methylase/3-demethylubiquinone-9 3-methyltransferase
VIRKILKNIPAGAVVADLGCGNGSMLAQFREFDWELHGFEWSQSGLSEATRAYPELRFEHVDLTTDLSSHRLAGKCDVVISTEVVEHVFLPRVYAKNCNTFLKRNGILVMSTPYHGYLKNLAIALMGKVDAHLDPLYDYGHIKFWSQSTLKSLLEQAGFEVQGFWGVGRVPLLWKSMVLLARP